MKHKFISILLTLVLALSLCLVTAVPVAAATITVDDSGGAEYLTIQEAITAATTDDIISVAAGTYEEDLVIPDTKTNLELVGATGAIIKGQATFPGPFPDGVPNIEILASGVKIHGFTIEGPDAATNVYSMGMYIGAIDVEICDNAFLTHTQEAGQYSVVIQTWRTGILEGVDISGLNIHDNTFDSAALTTTGYDGIFINIDTGTDPITIADNEFTGSLIRAIAVERSNVVISGNSIITDLGPGFPGGHQGMFIGCYELIEGQFDGPVQSNVSITGNTVNGFTQGITVGHPSQQIGFSDIIISQNAIEGNTIGVEIRARQDATPVGVVINYNNIVSNTILGVNNSITDVVLIDATENWWGTAVGVEIEGMVSGDVNYSNWLEGAIDTSTVTMAGRGAVPVVTTSAATDVLLYSATLHGELTDMGGASSVEVSFEYGETSGDLLQTAIVTESPLSVPGSFSVNVPGLTHNTTYYFQAKATVGELEVYGNELSFTTPTEQIGISVDPTSIDFGLMPIGQQSDPETVTVTNTGDVSVTLDTSITNESHLDVYTIGLKTDGIPVVSWTTNVGLGSEAVVPLTLTVPLETDPGTYTATLVFWAVETP